MSILVNDNEASFGEYSSEFNESSNVTQSRSTDEDDELKSSDQSEILPLHKPIDKYNGVYLLFYLLGMATLLPWNFFITANGYWMYKLRDLNNTADNTTHLTPMQVGFTSYLCVTSLVPSTVVLVLNAFIGHKFSFRLRIAGGLFGVIILFTFTTALVQLDTDPWQLLFYDITLASAFFINVVSSVFQGGVCGLAGKFPSEYIGAVISGQALGGIFASVANIVSIALGASAIESAFIYFLAALATLVLSFVLYFFLSSTDFFLYYSSSRIVRADRNISVKVSSLLESEEEDEVLILGGEISYCRIMREIWPYMFSVGLVYVVTLSLYPTIAVLVESTNRGHGYVWNDIYFTPVVCFLLMNLTDYIGRATAGAIPLPTCIRSWTCGLSILRVTLIPLMMMCNAHPRSNLPVLIPNDAGFVVIMAVFALTNGYLSTICFAMAPRSVSSEEQETASSLMAAALGIGLAFGGGLSSLLIHIL